MPSNKNKNFLVLNYDKLILAAAAVLLVVSGASLWNRSQKQAQDIVDFERAVSRPDPANMNAAVLDNAEFKRVVALANKPLSLSTNSTMLVAPNRMICVNLACAQIIPTDIAKCPFCGTAQPTGEVPDDWDSDRDEMTDKWEKEYGLNWEDASDATGDPDNDGFTNLEECKAGTNPRDSNSRPPLIDFLRVVKIDRQAFPFMLRGKTRVAENNYNFQLNDAKGRSYMIRSNPGGNPPNSGERAILPWKLASFEIFETIEKREGMPDRKVDLARLKLSDGKEEVTLVERAGPLYNVFVVTFRCAKRPGDLDIVVRQKETFEFDGEKYSISAMTSDPSNPVRIRNLSTNKETTIPEL